MTKKILFYATIIIVNVLLCSCQNNPTKQVVTSKNADDSKMHIEATADKQGNQGPEFEDVFFSTDGTVEFHFNIGQMSATEEFPIYEVVPHYLSETDVKRAAHAVFGDVEFLEAPPEFDTIYTKDEIRERIERWAPYTSDEAVYELFGEERDTARIVREFIEDYNKMYETAPDQKAAIPCQWTFKKESYYYDAAEEVEKMDTSRDDDMIKATVDLGDTKYTFQARTRNKEDYKLNYISAFLDGGISPDDIDGRRMSALLCRTEEPTEDQLAQAKQKAEEILRKIDLGDWNVDQCYFETRYYGDTPEYTVFVTAVPTINGIAAARYPQLGTYGADNDSYASNYFFTDACFEFSANGELLNFRMYSPIDVYNVIENNAPILGYTELLEKTRNLLALSDYYQYDRSWVIDFVDEEIGCTVDICECLYQMSRIKVPNTDDHYYYVPSLQIRGNIQMFGKQSENVYYASDTPETLLTLNAVDGSVINTTNQ